MSKKLLVTLAGHAPKRTKIRHNKPVNVAPGRSFDRLTGRYPVEPTPEKPVEQQIEAIRTKERSFTKRGQRIGGKTRTVEISNGDTQGVKQHKEIDDLIKSFDMAHDQRLAPPAHEVTGEDDHEPESCLNLVGDALGKDFAVFETVQYRKMPHWMRSKTKWKKFCEKLAIRKATYRQNVTLLKLSFERVGHTNEEIFEIFWDSQGRLTEPDDDGVLIVPNWPFKSLTQMVRRRAALLKLGDKMFGSERGRQRKPYKRLLCDQHSKHWIDRNGEEKALPIKVVEYLGNNEYVLKCGCHRTVIDYTAPDKSGKRKPIMVGKEAKNVEIVEPIEIFVSQPSQQLTEDQPAKVA